MTNLTARLLAEWMHNNYQECADRADWNVQKGTKTEFKFLPSENKKTMIFLAGRLVGLLEETKE